MAKAPATRLDEIMRKRDIRSSILAEMTGCHESTVCRYRLGERRIDAAWARLAAPYLGVQWNDLLEPIGADLSRRDSDAMHLIARRIEATRAAYWGADLRSASRALGATSGQLHAIERGRAEPSLGFLIRLLNVTGVNPAWIFHGTFEHQPVPAHVAARIAVDYPTLLPGSSELHMQARQSELAD